MAEIEEIACKHCGKFFMPRDGRSKYCGDVCRYEVKKLQVRANNKKAYELIKKEQLNKKCLVCNKKFKTMRSDIVTCSPFCQEERRKEQRRERKRTMIEEKQRLAAIPKRKTLAEIEAEARALGMHYGEYVLHLERQGKEKRDVV